jgi:4-hydroxy-tetrahydrodipicolinate synthase
MTRDDLPGVFAPVIMPFDEALAPDASRLLRQCRWLVSQGVGIAIFGTNSEANSLSVDEKIELLDRLIDGGIDRSLLMPGTGLCALPDTVRMTAHAATRGCAGALMLPPFYYKGVSDEGLFRAYAEVIERVADERLKIYLYHIPPVSQVPLSPGLIERLVKAYPGTVAGVKNSSGDWQNIRDMLSAGWDNFRVYCGSEEFLLRTMQLGGAGCISATANVNPAAIADLQRSWQASGADAAQERLSGIRAISQSYSPIPSLKSIVAHFAGDPGWRRLRPPLVELDPQQHEDLIARMIGAGFDMPGLGAAA